MGLLADHQIRALCQTDAPMIEPFVEAQQREGVISYGLSSYGYDMRIADEYKIFTNVHSAVVDPKNFTSDSFVDFQGEVCIIPPNSFVLARSIEFFRIPRNILAVCLGKSTYARCFRGDTRVALADGTTPTFEQLIERHESGEMLWGYSIGPFGRIIMTLLEKPRYIGRDSLVCITLDNDEEIYCTPDHEFVTRDGRLAMAHELRPNDPLMPFDINIYRGYAMVYQPLNGLLYPVHRLADEWNIRHGLYDDIPDTHRHHIDHNRLSNVPYNIQRMDASEHLRFPDVVAKFRSSPRYRNHKVVSVKDVAGDHDVYCLTVPEAGNFALASGVFVRNCGLIVNVTPFEPAWSGHVTIEISNTTPLPAKVYSNEGIAQVLFFEGDAEPEVSYLDRKGKYQGQRGVTLPRL